MEICQPDKTQLTVIVTRNLNNNEPSTSKEHE